MYVCMIIHYIYKLHGAVVGHGCGALWRDLAQGPGPSGQMMRIAGVWARSDHRGLRTGAPKTAKIRGAREPEEITLAADLETHTPQKFGRSCS